VEAAGKDEHRLRTSVYVIRTFRQPLRVFVADHFSLPFAPRRAVFFAVAVDFFD